MTTHIPLPSTQIVRRAVRPKPRFIYPLAAVCLTAAMLTPTHGSAQVARASQSPASVMAVAARPTLVLARGAETAARPQDIAYNNAQIEPAIRKHHAVQKRFDAFVDAKVDAYCPDRDRYARFVAGRRYEQGQFVEPSTLASPDVEANVSAGLAYAPQDGRYAFDFSGVRMSFDEAAVDVAVKNVCSRVHAAGRDFLAKIDLAIAQKDWNNAFKLDQWAHGRLGPIRASLKAKLDTLSPGGFAGIQVALRSGRKVK